MIPIHVRCILLVALVAAKLDGLAEKLKSFKAKQINRAYHKRVQKHKDINKWHNKEALRLHARANKEHNKLDKQDERDNAVYKLLKGDA